MFEPEDFEVEFATWSEPHFIRQAILKGTVSIYETSEKEPISILITREDRTHKDIYNYELLVHNQDYVNNRKGRGSYLPPTYKFYESGRLNPSDPAPSIEEILRALNKELPYGHAFKNIIHWIFM